MADIYEQLESCILLLDGGFGTMVQQYGLTEEDYRGERFREWPALLKGCNDLLALTRPEAVREIHVKYLQAGADIIETDSFNANAVSLADYGLEAYAYEMSRAAAAVARSANDGFGHFKRQFQIMCNQKHTVSIVRKCPEILHRLF